jgi:hypothetical protein
MLEQAAENAGIALEDVGAEKVVERRDQLEQSVEVLAEKEEGLEALKKAARSKSNVI